jgi:hypothetical protein
MKTTALGGLFGLASALVLAACAAQRPASPAAPATAAASAASPTAAVPGTKKNAPGNARRVMKQGVEYFCARDVETGSRLASTETCLTDAQWKVRRERDQELLRQQQAHVGDQGSGTSVTRSATSP